MKNTKYVVFAVVVWMATAMAVPAGAEVVYPKLFIQANVLAESLKAPDLRIIDCRREPELYQKGHIPGAVFFNVFKELRVESASKVPGVRRMLEDQEDIFGGTLGINSQTMVVLYDDTGWDATRLFWELNYVGHDRVAILYGGWPEWEKQGLPVSTEATKADPQVFVVQPDAWILATKGFILANLANPKVAILDCRPPEQFVGTAKHPAAAVGGRIPGAVNVYTLTLWDNKTYLKPPDKLEGIYEDRGITRDKTIVTYCNTGYFASNTFFVLRVLGYPDVRMYDFSWVEWASKDYLPKIVPAK